jgi:oxygen-dependent protoporphyrinogen oxidase
MKQIAVIGGGITGLTAAYYLEKLAPPDCEITLFERSQRLGGVISSPVEDGFRFEEGPDSFLSYKPAALELVEDLGITDRLVNSNIRSVYVVKEGKLVSFPAGFQFFVPTGWGPLMRTKLLGWGTKLGVAREALRHRSTNGTDMSVADFARDRFGPEISQYLAEPLLSGIYGGDAEKLSMVAVLPQFLEYEKKYGNAIRGVIAAAQSTQKSKPKWAPFVSFQQGMQELPDRLISRLNRTRMRMGESVQEIAADGNGYRVQGERFDAVICGMPPVHSGRLLRTAAPDVAEILAAIPCASTVTVSLFYREGDLPTSKGGFGFVVPRAENRKILACSWLSAKFPGRAPDGYTYVRGFLSGVHDGAEALDSVLAEMRDLMGVKRQPEKARVAHWPEVMAQPLVGHRERIAELRRSVDRYPRLALAGNFFEGIGIPDCIRTARMAAERVLTVQ